MSDYDRHSRLRVLAYDGKVAVDADGTLLGVSADEAAPGFPLAPELLLDVGGPLILDVRRPADPSAYSRWSLVEHARGDDAVLDPVGAAIRVFGGTEAPPPRRAEWFSESWLPEVEAWLDQRLGASGRRRTGALEPLKVWSLSAVLRVPTDDGVLIFKAACDWFRAEPRITEVLAGLWPDRIPALVAVEAERGWQLMEPLAGVPDEGDPPPELAEPTAVAMAGLQVAALAHLDDLARAGLPDRGLDATLAGLRQVAEHSVELDLLDPDERARVTATLPRVAERITALADWGVPETLVHGDLHLGNVAAHGQALVIFDWTDACLAHPLVDRATLLPTAHAERPGLGAAYCDVWRPLVDLPPPEQVEHEARVLERAFQAITYERIQAALEEASRWEFAGVVAHCLRRLVETV